MTSRGAPDDPWEVAGTIGGGLCVFVGVTHDDDDATADKLAGKICGLRVFDDDAGVMNRSVADAGRPAVLVVSQFTLYGDTRKGRRPSWAGRRRPTRPSRSSSRSSTAPALGEPTVGRTGRFRTEMRVELVNDGPVTLLIDV